jgi:hypothetical protein
VRRRVTHHADVVALERRSQTLLNIGQEDFPVHWPINDHRRYHLIMTQGGYERHRLPRSLRNVTDQAHAARAGSPETDHIGGGRSLIEEYQSGRIEKRLLPYPAPPRASHIRAMLLGRPQVFFNSDVMPIEKTPERAAAARNPSLTHRHDQLIQGSIRVTRQ